METTINTTKTARRARKAVVTQPVVEQIENTAFTVEEIREMNAMIDAKMAVDMLRLPKEKVIDIAKAKSPSIIKLKIRTYLEMEEELAAAKQEEPKEAKITPIKKADVVETKQVDEYEAYLAGLKPETLEKYNSLTDESKEKVRASKPQERALAIGRLVSLEKRAKAKPAPAPKESTTIQANASKKGKTMIECVHDFDEDTLANFHSLLSAEAKEKVNSQNNRGLAKIMVNNEVKKMSSPPKEVEEKKTSTLTDEELEQLNTLAPEIAAKINAYTNVGIQRIQIKRELAKMNNEPNPFPTHAKPSKAKGNQIVVGSGKVMSAPEVLEAFETFLNTL